MYTALLHLRVIHM